MEIAQRLAQVRAAMATQNLDAMIIPSNDPHQSEYVAQHWMSRQWISGFTGSAAVVVVTPTEAGLWTDSRYFLQAEKELAGSPITFHKQIVQYAPEHHQWLKDNLKAGARLAVDGNLISIEGMKGLNGQFEGTDIHLVVDQDPIAVAWQDRPTLPDGPIFEQPVDLAGQSREAKLAAIRTAMQKTNADHHLVVSLDDIAWICNLRGNDVDFNPLFYGYLLVSADQAQLFIPPNKLPAALEAQLAKDGFTVRDYFEIGNALGELQGNVLLDPHTTSVALQSRLGAKANAVFDAPPSTMMKALKNPVELAGVRNAMEKDGVALLRLCRWLEGHVNSGTVTEFEVGERLAGFRADQEGYFGESFPAIAGYASNGAMVHYRPLSDDCAILKPVGVFLLDSGGQYRDGTTDITRVFALGEVPAEAVRAYTAVLKGMIALCRARFPKGTIGLQLDAFARNPIWAAGFNYGHGTGHGVGAFLSVHEGPHGIGPSLNARTRTPFEPGMIVSNEPGYYKEGGFGIRIENLILCVEGPVTESGHFLEFETLSLFPIETTMVDWGGLDSHEVEWLRGYHAMVFDRLSPRLDAEERDWLRGKCGVFGA